MQQAPTTLVQAVVEKTQEEITTELISEVSETTQEERVQVYTKTMSFMVYSRNNSRFQAHNDM